MIATLVPLYQVSINYDFNNIEFQSLFILSNDI